MLKKVIHGWNAAPGAPKDWNPERDGECGALPIRATFHTDGTISHVESAWEPTPTELAQLNSGGSVILRIVGWQPPVALFVEPYDADNPHDIDRSITNP